jgi:hypothetical protein
VVGVCVDADVRLLENSCGCGSHGIQLVVEGLDKRSKRILEGIESEGKIVQRGDRGEGSRGTNKV